MNYKWIGGILIITASIFFGCSLTVHQKREEALIRQLSGILDQMLLELPYQLTPLPELLRHASEHTSGTIGTIFSLLIQQLERQVLPDVSSCMDAAISDTAPEYPALKNLLQLTGQSLGRFDLNGQLKGLAAVREQCDATAAALQSNRNDRLRSYRVISICAGIALVILLI